MGRRIRQRIGPAIGPYRLKPEPTNRHLKQFDGGIDRPCSSVTSVTLVGGAWRVMAGPPDLLLQNPYPSSRSRFRPCPFSGVFQRGRADCCAPPPRLIYPSPTQAHPVKHRKNEAVSRPEFGNAIGRPLTSHYRLNG